MCRRFGFVAQAATSPSGQLRQDLHALGWDGQRSVTVISDGEPALPNLIRAAVDGLVRHILDWWHISMRVQHIENAIKGLLQTENFPGFPELFKRPAQTLRWCLWHGKIMTAGTRLKLLMIDSGRVTAEDAVVRAAVARVEARCRELYTYLANNWDALTNYGWRQRNGFSISSSRAEGCVDDIGNARMGKRRRMRWSPRGAHNVAVTRAAVPDGRLSRFTRPRCTNSGWAAFAPFPGSLFDTFIGRATEMGHAVESFDSDPGFGCLSLHFAVAKFRSDDLFVTPDLGLAA